MRRPVLHWLRTFALRALHALAWTSALGCDRTLPPDGQIVLHVATDAPVGPSADGTPPIFDRLRIEIIPPDATPCVGCSREFAIEDDRMARGEASIGIVAPKHRPGYRARIRLFRSGGTASGEPRPRSTIEHLVALPEVPDEGLAVVSAILPVSDVGTSRGTDDAPVALAAGRPPEGIVGSYTGARRTACRDAPADDQACVPGGMFWMGNPRLDVVDTRLHDGRNERLVVLSPFYLDLHEVTVAEMRAANVARVLDDPLDHEVRSDCDYTAAPGPYDDLPVNCLSWQRARAFCEKVGKRLPTEAEWEYAAGALAGRAFVWGEDVPTCEDAVYGRDGVCSPTPAPTGASFPSPPGSGVRDRLVLGDRVVVDLAGNVREMTQDRFEREDSPCLSPTLLHDPICGSADDSDRLVGRTVRGGSHFDPQAFLRASLRGFVENERYAISSVAGFRCARSAKPARIR